MIYSASAIYALQKIGDSNFFLIRHLIFLLIGFCLMLGCMAFDYRVLQKYAKPLLVLTLFLLVAVLLPGIGKESSGAQRWFKIGSLSFQPSEFAKLAMIVYIADFLARKKEKIRDLKEGFLPVMSVLGIICVLILKQPDLGTTVFIALIVLIMIFIAGARMLYLGLIALAALPVLYLLIFRVRYRLVRILSFINPWQDSQGIGFQLSQSQIALGSGKIFGVGLGHSMQKLFYLPAAHTDFIFSIIGEELGLIGTLSVVMLFAILIWQGARIIKRTPDEFGFFLGVGIVLMIGIQALINIGVSIGAFPTKGLPLPFVSYGGSALVFNMMAIGLLLNISRTQEL